MKTYLTISELVKRLNIKPSQYNNFKAWCYKHKDKLDTQDCKWNHGYYTYNVKLVSELYRKKHAATSPVEAAETLATALSTATGRNVTGSDVLAAYERGKDYIRMRRTMARTLWRMRKARRKYEIYCESARNGCMKYWNACDNAAMACDYRYRKMDKRESLATNAAVVTMVLYIITALAFLTYIFCQ